MKNEIVVWDDLRNFVVPLGVKEKDQLEENLKSEGCRDPLIVWDNNNELVLIDGHNRFEICNRNHISYSVKKMFFEDIEEVKVWMINNQLGRRNLNQDQISYYRGLKYESFKRKKGGYEYVESKGRKEQPTSEILAQEFKVSESTVKRDAKFALGLEVIGKSNLKLKRRILTGEAKVKKSDVQTLAQLINQEDIKIVNEADIFNKAKQIRNETISQIEKELSEVNDKKIAKARETLEQLEPIFTEKNERIQRIKANIISAINLAINARNQEAITKIKNLIDRLEDELIL